VTTNKAETESAGFALFDTPIGRCAIVWLGDRIIGSSLPESTEARLRARLAVRFAGARETSPPAHAAEAIREIQRLLAGEKVDLSNIELGLDSTTNFEDHVYDAARRIPCGEVRTYGDIAQEIGEPGAARAVGAALGRNPVPIIIPCHRVLGSAGKSGGFSAPGGTETKFRMLEIEQARRPGDPELFESLPLAVKPNV
jgi:methylated-DNA-[protein]-cysteine S-methyltransferase